MKKISIMLLAALMLFAFVACNPDENGDKAGTLTVAKAAATDTVFGKDATAKTADKFVQDTGYAIGTDNKVTAKLVKVEEAEKLTGYPITGVETGYFLPVKVTTDFGTGDNAKADIKVVVSGITALTSNTTATFEDVAKDGFVLIYLGSDISTMTNAKATLTATNAANEKWEVVLDLSGVEAATTQGGEQG